jgi:hypothetical protein
MSKSDGRSDVKLTKELGLVRCSCGRCCNAKLVKELQDKIRELEEIVEDEAGADW